MKKIAFLLLVVMCTSLAVAQDAPKASVFGGYQLFSLDGGLTGDRTSLHGWNADVAGRVSNNISIVGDFGGNYKKETATIEGITGEAKLHLYNFVFGPRVSAHSGKVTPFAQALFGVSHVSMSGSVDGVGSGSDSVNKFAMAFGGGLDVDVNKNVAVRVGKFDYFIIRGGSDVGNLKNLRFATGIVLKF